MPAQTDVERLRGIFLKRARESYGLKEEGEWTPQQAARDIANCLPGLYGLVRAARDTTNPHRFWDKETLTLEVQRLGFPSAPALVEALDQVRDSLKPELLERDWEISFRPTTDTRR